MDKKLFDDFRRSIEARVNERANRVANEVSGEVVKVFVKRAKKRLINSAKNFTYDTAQNVTRLVDNITYEEQPYFEIGKTTGKPKEVTRAYVRVRRDPQDLLMYLEYGTGLVGEAHRHPEASKIGWQYGVNREKYVSLPKTKTGKGWIFTRKPTSTVLKDDVPIHRYWTERIIFVNQVITIKKGKNAGKTYKRVQPYHRKTKTSHSVFSEGMKPVRYIYDTKQELNGLFRAGKGSLTVDQFYKKLHDIELK